MALLPHAAVLAWDHNAYYHRLILRRLPPESVRVLDAGCGAGVLAVKLAHRVPYVDAVDRDARMVECAQQAAAPGVRVEQADLLSDALPDDGYDAIISLSVLHHLPLDVALPQLAAALRPGGRLIALALPRLEWPRDLPIEVMAAGAQAVAAVVLAVVRLGGSRVLLKNDTGMPVAVPTLTVRDVREQAQAVLPGTRVRRLLFWRYLLEYERPAD